MSKRERFVSGKFLALSCLIIIIAAAGFLRAEDPIAHGQVIVRGVSLKIDPANQAVPVNTPTIVNTIFAAGTTNMIPGMILKGELRGPGISGAIALSTLPGHPFAIPGFPYKGTYALEDIRLENNGKVLLRSTPDRAVIDVSDIIVTQVKTRPLTLAEIREKGIVITQENFTVYNFSVGLLVESMPVNLDFPVIFTPQGMQVVSSGGGGGGGLGGVSGREMVPFVLELPEIPGPDISDTEQIIPTTNIAGILVFNNKIGFLNQFFSAMFIISNNAPAGSPLAIKDLKATIVLPAGLREAKTNPPHISGTPIPVRCPGPDGKIGTADDVDVILATFNGMAEFLAEGLKEGTHTIKINFEGILAGLPAGDTLIKGSAMGAVLVRNPAFSVVFSHPDVVRSGEEYDIYMTLTNTAKVCANLVSLTMPKAGLIGTELLSDERIEFETIASAESQIAKFHMRSKQTGKVRATAFEAQGNVHGQFVLTAAVGEQGIPLSPDTLVLPAYAYSLPANVIEAAMLLLGEAYSISQAPAGLLPANLPLIKKETVQTRAVELIEAGQRIEYGESLLPSIEVFLLDWLGNRSPDLPFDQLRRLTSKGGRLAAAINSIFSEALKSIAIKDFQKELAQTCYYKKPFFSAALTAGGVNLPCHLRINDSLANRLGDFSAEIRREIPYGEFFSLTSNSANNSELGLVGVYDNNGYRVEVKGREPGRFALSLIVPGAAGNIRQVLFANVECRSNSLSWLQVTAADNSFVLATDFDGDGKADTTITGTVTPIARPPLRLLAAIQDCAAHKAGHAVALFFNQALDVNSTKVLENYACAPKKVLSAFMQPSQRVVIIGLDNPVSPFVESVIKVSGLQDTAGNAMDPSTVEMPIKATIRTPGGIVFGTVLTASGVPIANASLQLGEYDSNDGSYTISALRSDASGNYQFDFVRMLPDPFSITVKDPVSGKIEKIRTSIRSNGQRLRIDLIMRGRGSLGGRVLLNDAPAAGAYVKATAENGIDNEFYVVQTNSAGEYLINNIPLGRISLFAVKGNAYGYQAAALSYAGEAGSKDIPIFPGKTGIVIGRVLTNDGITAVAATQVRIRKTDSNDTFSVAATDGQGNFIFPQVPVGPYYLRAYNPSSGTLGSNVAVTVYDGQTAEVTIILRGNGSVNGLVLTSNHTPCPGIIVYINGTPFNTLTDSKGEFNINDVPIGTYTVMAFDTVNKLQASAQAQIISEGQQAGVTLIFPNPALGGISGTVYLADGTPAVDANVYVADGNYMFKDQCRSSNSGSFAFSNLAAGSYILVAVKGADGGVANATVQFAGHFANRDIFFCGLGAVEVHTLASDGESPVMADVIFNYPVIELKQGDSVGFNQREARVSSGAAGKVIFSDILARSFSVSARNAFYPGGASASGKISVGEKITVDLVFDGASKPGTIQGTVFGPYVTTPVPGAAVTLKAHGLPPQSPNDGAGSNGEFSFTLVPPGPFTIEASDPINGYRGMLRGSMGGEGQTVTIAVRLKGKGEVYGQVKTLQGAVVPKAKVTIKTIGFPDEKFIIDADSEGNFSQERVSEGQLALEAKDPVSLIGGRANGTLAGNNTRVQINIALETSGTVSGRVLDVDGLKTIAGAQVILYHASFKDPFGYYVSDQDGKFEFLFVPAGSFYVEVFAQASGRRGRKSGKIVNDGETVDIDVSLEARGTVQGTFYDGSGTNPIAGAYVKIKSKDIYHFETESNTDEGGHFRFTQIAQGDFDISAVDEATGRAGKASGKIEYEEQTVTSNIQAAATGIVSCRVFKAGGAVATNPILTLNKENQTTPDDQGVYHFKYIPLGAFTVVAAAPNSLDRGSASGRIDFHGQEVSLDITFNGLGTVSGLVKDANGNPQSGINVKLTAPNNPTFNTTTSDGTFIFPPIRIGPFDLTAKDPFPPYLGATASGQLTQDGETVSLEMTLDPSGAVTGTVFNADGATPAEHATVTLSGNNSTCYRSVAADGTFSFDTVKLGTYAFKITGLNNAGLFRTSVLLQSHDETIDLGNISLDDQLPQVTSIFPAQGASNLPLNTVITVNFSEVMDATSLAKAFSLSGRQGKIAGTLAVDADGLRLTFTPNALPGFASYTVALATTAEDTAGNCLESPVTASFTTLDNIPPAVLAIDPPNNKIQVATNSPITVTFSEPLATDKFTAANFIVKRSGVQVAGEISFAPGKSIVIFSPAALQADSVYSVSVKEAGDLAGNVQTNPYASTFYTVDTIVPVLSLTPPAGTTVTVKEGTAQTVKANVNGATDVANVYFFINGELKYTDNASPYQYDFSVPYISSLGQNTFLLEALAVDKVGNQSVRQGLQFSLLVDTPPNITLSGPANTSVLPRQTITCPVQANDDIALKQVIFKAIGGNLNYQSIKQRLSQY